MSIALALVLTACTSPAEPAPEELTSPLVACDVTAASADPATDLPDVTLPCFTGGVPVSLRAVGKPMVVNLWASWCEPCRTELPAFQRLWTRAAGKVAVFGVITNDSRMAAAGLADDLSLTFPSVFDAGAKFQAGLGRTTLPMTLFVDATGKIAYQHLAGALGDSELNRLVADKLGVELG